MGRHIDRALVSGLLTGLFFCALRGFVRTIPVCMLLSFLFGAALYRLSRQLENGSRRLKRRKRTRRAEAYLDALVLRQADEQALKSVLPEGAALLLRLPDSALGRDEVLSRWREAGSPLTLAVTCAIPRQTAEFASSLPEPQIALIGRSELIRRLARSPVPLPDRPLPRLAFRARLAQMLQKNRLGMLGSCLYGGILLCLYLLTGVGAYLIGSLCLIAIGGVTLYVRRRS